MRRQFDFDPRIQYGGDDNDVNLASVAPSYPRHRFRQVPNTHPPMSPEWMDRAFHNVILAMEDIATLFTDESHRVDEYRPQSFAGVPGESMSIESWLPDYKDDEIIEAIIVTGPVTPLEPLETFNVTTAAPVAAPAAGTTIVSSPLQSAGLYTYEWTVELTGAPAAGDLNNFGLYINGVLIATSENLAAAGVYPQQTTAPLNSGLNTVTVRNIGIGTGTYSASIVGNQLPSNPPTFTLQLGRRSWTLQLPTTGILVIAPIKLSLTESSTRQLNANTPGDWAVELMGFTDTGRRGRV